MRDLICLFMVCGAVAFAAAQARAETIAIDFGSCVPAQQRVDVAFGSTTYKITGMNGNNCVMLYGGEVEDPSWNGSLGTTCTVPASLGVQTFEKGNNGVDFSPIQAYCTDGERRGSAEEERALDGCQIGGCSGQLCLETRESEELSTTCEWLPVYDCYKTVTCQRQANGKCGWTETPEFTGCLEKSRGK